MKYLLVEDTPEIGSAVKEHFVSTGHAVDWVENLGDARDYLGTSDYDLIILDIMLPDGDGREILRELGEERPPVLALTARSKVSDRVEALDLGADDYLTKPFHFDELDARVRAIQRRRRGAKSSKISVAALTFDPISATVEVKGKRVDMRNRELRLLETLLSDVGRVYSKTQLVDRIFSLDEDVSENAIEVYIARVRRKIEGSGLEIKTQRGIGYCLVEKA